MLHRISSDIMSKVHHFATFPQTGVSLRQMVEFGKNPCQGTLLRAALFLSQELPVRLAHRVVELDNLPDGLSEAPSVQRVKLWYADSFEELSNFPHFELPRALKEKYRVIGAQNNALNRRYYAPFDPQDMALLPPEAAKYNADFVGLIKSIKGRHDAVVRTIAQGIVEWKSVRGSNEIDPHIQSFLDRFYLSRIGIRMLIGQHIALNQPPTYATTDHGDVSQQDYVGVICTRTPIQQIAQEAVDNARFICEDHYGLFTAPRVDIVCPGQESTSGQDGLTFMYVPSHLHHMLFELLKNSLRAVVEHHGIDADHYPPIKLVVVEGKEDITIKISDEGGGIPRSDLPSVWTYMYTTAENPILDPLSTHDNAAPTQPSRTDIKAPMAGYGYGLPISRLYARYFGGDLKIISMEGYGTDAYLHLSRLSDSEEPLP